MGRQKNEVWVHFEKTKEGKKWKCKHCGKEYGEKTSATRLKDHIDKREGRGIEVCTGSPQSNNFGHRKSNEEAGHIEVGSSSVSNRENDYFQILQYVFDCLSPRELVFRSPRFHLTQKEFSTLKPESYLDSWVIDIFAEILTESEEKKATPSNWYLPVMFSTKALQSDESNFKDFVQKQNIRENYTSHIKLPEKVFIPVHIGPETGGHFYLYIFHFNKNVIEIWDSLHNNRSVAATERDETTKKLLFAMEILLEKEKGEFSNYKLEMRKDILSQPNLFDCGIFVINYMQQSDDYMNPSFKFDSEKEREGLALKLLNNHLNQEKQNLYDKARRYYAQVEKQDDNKRLRLDPSKQNFEDIDDPSNNEEDEEEEDDDNDDLIGWQVQSYTEIREWINDDKVSAIGVWGTGGSGKTALATHIYDKLLEEGDIKVIWVTVSQNSISHLQKVIAKSIELDISGELEVKVIARKLFQGFKVMEEKCVIMLDDVWDHFFLKEVGFPISDNRVKLILTTRIWDVCQGMDCKEYTRRVKPLDEEDSCALFQKTMGLSYDVLSSEVKKIARRVADECEGLPLAVVRIAESMKGKEQAREWSHMLECLKNLGNGQYEIDKWVLPVLRSSYDFLTNKLQRLFLYWALSMSRCYWDGYNNEDYMIRRFVYERIDETKKLREQYDESLNMLDRLRNHSMLEQCHRRFGVKKFLRLLAICIVEATGKIMANAFNNLTKIPRDSQWREDLQKVFLTGNNIQTILDGSCLRCSQLSTLLLDTNSNLSYISDDFFNNMPALVVLDLSYTHIKRLPESVSNLECLNALLLSWCKELSYIPSLSKLKGLISLDLSDTAITEAPMGLESCVNLRCLNVLHTYMLLPSSLISKLVNLEHLLGPKVTETNIQSLDKLEVIMAFFQDISGFNTYVRLLQGLTWSFHLILADAKVMYDYGVNELKLYEEYYSKSIKRINFDSIDLGNIKAVLPRDMKGLFIESCQLVETIDSSLCSVVSLDGYNNNDPHQIELLDIRTFIGLKYLFCISSNCPFCTSYQLVGSLNLNDLDDLKDIVSPNANPSWLQRSRFSLLTELKIGNCSNMESLITPKLLALLQNIHTIVVFECKNMKEIVVGDDDSHQMKEDTPSGSLIDDVNSRIRQPTTITLPKLTSLKLWDMPGLAFVCRNLVLFPSLHTFSAVRCHKLTYPLIQTSNECDEPLPIEKTPDGYCWP